MSGASWTQALAVAGGAAAGGLLRWRAALWLNQPGVTLPLGTWFVNAAGGFAIGLALALLPRDAAHPLRLLLVTGFLGGFTTFSAFSAESLDLLQRGEPAGAVLHAGAHVLGSLLLCGLGWALGQWWRGSAGAPA